MGSQAIPVNPEQFTAIPKDFFNQSPQQRESFISQVVNRADLGVTSDIAKYVSANEGSLAKYAEPIGSGHVDILQKYQWTVSNILNRNDIPYIELFEHKITGGAIQKQFNFYASGISDTTGDLIGRFINGAQEPRGVLDVYDEIFVPNSTGFKYTLPYFAKACYELTTNQWQQFDTISQSLNQIVGGVGKLFGKTGEQVASAVTGAVETAGSISQTALQFNYPVVGIADRPRIFTAHNERSITIEFPLYNTLQENEWKRNKDFIQLFMYQNLFNKRNFITGLPPSWYKVKIPGVYYSVASCVTNFTAENLGNVRVMTAFNKEFIVPDAYQVRITLQEMAMPSKNQFESSITGEGQTQRVTSTSQS